MNSGQLGSQVGRDLNLSLNLRGRARYKARTELTLEDAEFVIGLGETLLEYAKKKLREK